jgi:hypothetical protein
MSSVNFLKNTTYIVTNSPNQKQFIKQLVWSLPPLPSDTGGARHEPYEQEQYDDAPTENLTGPAASSLLRRRRDAGHVRHFYAPRLGRGRW